MKIILLRHEERGYDISFFSNLVENGIIRACTTLPKELQKLKPDIIFSSPFIRTLQTIYPYSQKNNIKINVEYGLYEYMHNPYFLLGQWYYTLDDIKDNDLKTIINNNYKSIVDKNDFSILEDENDLEKRINKFMNNFKINYPNKTILLVTHKGIINKIKNVSMNSEFPMGHYEILNFT